MRITSAENTINVGLKDTEVTMHYYAIDYVKYFNLGSAILNDAAITSLDRAIGYSKLYWSPSPQLRVLLNDFAPPFNLPKHRKTMRKKCEDDCLLPLGLHAFSKFEATDLRFILPEVLRPEPWPRVISLYRNIDHQITDCYWSEEGFISLIGFH